MTSLRTRLFIVISLMVFIILAISLFLLYRSKRAPTAAPSTPSSTATTGNVITRDNFVPGKINPTPVVVVDTQPAPTYKPTTEEVEKNAARQLARIFVERYNTYSTDSNYENIREVQSLVSEAMWKRISKVIGNPPASNYTGVTTLVVSTELTVWQPPAATVVVKTLKTTQQNGVTSDTYQTQTVTLVKNNGSWLVDSFVVQK